MGIFIYQRESNSLYNSHKYPLHCNTQYHDIHPDTQWIQYCSYHAPEDHTSKYEYHNTNTLNLSLCIESNRRMSNIDDFDPTASSISSDRRVIQTSYEYRTDESGLPIFSI